MMKVLEKIFKRNKPQKNIYEVLDQDQGVYRLVKRFYEIMENDPKAKECLETHELQEDGTIPDEVKKKLFMFLCGWFGGPNLFVEAYGHPRMRARHMHIAIGAKEKEQWLYCMYKALDEQTPRIPRNEKKSIKNSFLALAMRIQNKE